MNVLSKKKLLLEISNKNLLQKHTFFVLLFLDQEICNFDFEVVFEV